MFSFQFEMKYLKRLSDPLNEITALDAYDCAKSVLRNLHALYIVKNTKLAKEYEKLAAAYKAGYPEYKLKQFIDVLADGIMRSNEDITIIKFREWLARNEVRADMNKSVPGEEEYLKLQATLKAYEEGKILQRTPRGKTEYYKFYEGTYKI